MAEYSLTAEALLSFGRNPPQRERAFVRWAAFADKVGQSILPFIIRPDRFEDVPFRALGMTPVKLSDMVPQPGEMWVLFCFKDSFREIISFDSPLRTDGFPLVLEWRRGQPDSELLSSAFRDLAKQVRGQFGEDGKGWGLHPAFDRYGDTIAFTDSNLFSDAENSLQIASAWGALAAGLHCCIQKKFPGIWPFPSVQWDWEHKRAAGVAGIEKKLSVAADCKATVVTVASEQKKDAQELLAKLKKSEDGDRYGSLSILAARNVDDPKVLARRMCDDVIRRIHFRRLMLSAVVFLVCLMVAAGLFLYDMTRPVSLYFADYVDCYGLPEGIYEVPKRDLRMRSSTYRFDYQGYYWHGVHLKSLPHAWFGIRRKLKRVVHVGPTDIPTEESNEFLKPRPIIMKFVYDEDGRLMKKIIHKRGGKDFVSGPIIKNMHYANRQDGARIITNGRMWETFDDGSFYFLRGNVTQRKDSTGDARTRITHSNIERDIAGRMTSIRFLSAPDMIPACDKDGVYGVEYDLTHEKDEGVSGRIKEQRHLDEKGDRMSDRYGVATIRFGYSGSSLNSIEYFNKARGLVRGRAGFYRSFRQYDSYGNCTNRVLKNKYDKPAYRILRDEDKRMELGGSQTWASCSHVFSNGLMVARSIRSPNGELLQRNGVVTTVRLKYDDWGDCIFLENLDAKGGRVISPDGYSVVTQIVDHCTGESTGIKFFMEDGVTPAYNENGVAGIERSYDERLGLVIEEKYCDGTGRLMANKDGVAMVRQKFDGRGQVVQQTFYDAATNVCAPVYLGGNVGCVKLEYPKKMEGVEKVRFFRDATCRSRATRSDGASGFFTKYDEFGRTVECWDVDEKDSFLCRKNDSSMRRIHYGRVIQREEIVPQYYAEKGWRVVKTTYCSSPENPFYTEDGFCSKREIFDAFGNIVFEIWEDDEAGRIDKKSAGYAVVVNSWSAVGELESQYYYDKAGVPVLDKATDTAGYEMTYDTQTHELKSTRYVDVDHRNSRCIKDEKYSEIRYLSTPDGMKETSYWHNDKPVRHSQNYHKVRRVHDVYGNPLDEWYFNETNGHTECVMKNGFTYHHSHAEYDAFRRRIMACRYDVNDVLCQTQGYNFCVVEWKYDSLHRNVETLWIRRPDVDTVKHPSYNTYPGCDGDGVSRMLTTYHGMTQTVSRKDEYGLKDSPCLYGCTGAWHKVTMYDVKGNETNSCTYATDGSLACDSNNVHTRTYTYFDDSVRHKRRDLYGRDMWGITGIVHSVTWYDSNDNVVEECYFGDNEHPVADKDGMTKSVREYFTQSKIYGRRDEFGVKGNACLYGNTGVWHRVTQYDLLGRITKRSHFSESDEPIADKNGIIYLTVSYTNGVQYAKRCDFYGTDLFGSTGVCHKVKLYDANGKEVYEAEYLADNKINWRRRLERGDDGQDVVFAFVHKAELIRANICEGIQSQQNIAGVNLSFDGLGRISCIEYCDEGGNVVEDKNGVAKKQYFYHGNTKEEARIDKYGLADAPCLYGATGVWHKVELYDTSGKLTNYCHYALDGNPATDKDNVHEYRRQYFQGSKIYAREDKYGLASLPRLCGTTGIWHTVILYDQAGNETNHCHFALDGSRACNTDNQYELAFAYFDNPFRSKRRDVWGRDIWGNTNVAHVVTWFDKRGNLVEQFHFDAKEQPITGNVGVAHLKEAYYGDSDVLFRLDEFSLKDNPCLYGSTGVWHSVSLYDSSGNETNFCLYAIDGRAVCDSNNVYARTLAYFEDEERHKRRDLYGSNVWHYVGVAHVVTWYDKKERVVEQAYFNEAEKPIGTLLGSGITRTQTRYHDGSDVVARYDNYSFPFEYLKTDVWHTVKYFDIVGRLTNECHFSKTEQPAADFNGIVSSTRSYYTNQVGFVERLDLYGSSIWGQRGLSHVVRYFDRHNRNVEELQFDAYDKPRPNAAGYFRRLTEYVGDTKRMLRREELGDVEKSGLYGFPGIVRFVSIFDRDDGDLLSMTGYYANGRKQIFRHLVFDVDDLKTGGNAEKLGVRRGDILCKLNDIDLLLVSGQKELLGIFRESESTDKQLVVARKNDFGGFCLLTFNLPNGEMGMLYSQRPISDKDHLELVQAKAK